QRQRIRMHCDGATTARAQRAAIDEGAACEGDSLALHRDRTALPRAKRCAGNLAAVMQLELRSLHHHAPRISYAPGQAVTANLSVIYIEYICPDYHPSRRPAVHL